MLRNLIVCKGLVQGKRITLENGTNLPDGETVLVAIAVPDGTDGEIEIAKQQLVG